MYGKPELVFSQIDLDRLGFRRRGGRMATDRAGPPRPRRRMEISLIQVCRMTKK